MVTFYSEHQKKQLFFELTTQDTGIRIRRGLIGKPCLVFEIPLDSSKVDSYCNRLTYEKIEKGFEQKKGLPKIIEGSKANILRTKETVDHEVYGGFMKLPNVEYFYGDTNYAIFHFANGLTYDGNLDLEELVDLGNVAGVIIEGEVRVSGILSQLTDSYPGGTLILGNVFAKSFAKHNSHIVIDGNLSVEQTVFGYYNDGSLKVTGDASGEVWLSSDHDMYAEGNYKMFQRDVFNEGNPDWLNPKLIDSEDDVDEVLLLKYIMEGKSLLKKGVVYNHKEFLEAQIIKKENKVAKEAAQFDPKLIKKIDEFAIKNDNMGITLTLVNWSERNESWAKLCDSRLYAPSCSDTEEKLVQIALNQFKKGILSPPKIIVPPIGFNDKNAEVQWHYPASGQVSDVFKVHPKVQQIIDSFEAEATTLSAFKNLPERTILEAHSGWLYFQAMEGPPLYIALIIIDNLLALDLNPNVTLDTEDLYGSTNPVLHAQKVGHTEILSRIYKKYDKL